MDIYPSRPEPYKEGYPRSSEADLDPGPDRSESLDDADRAACDEHRVVPERRRPGAVNDEDRSDYADDLDDAESRH